MKKNILRYFKHIFSTFLIVLIAIVTFGLYHGASLRYGENPKMMEWQQDGPYIFFKNDSLVNVNYVKGDQKEGFYLDQKEFKTESLIHANVYFALDKSTFNVAINTKISNPISTYNDGEPILAISDIESSFKAFRDLLFNCGVIDKDLRWTFKKGHLVLVGDFVDRDHSTTQVLWLIYKLEQEAAKQGGTVHYILGNHELKNMQGNFDSSSPKYYHIASILGKSQMELYGKNSFLGKWMSSKNSIEKINQIIFTHGGMHPDIVKYNLNIDSINTIVRENYYKPYYPKPENSAKQFITSSATGISWYRGYFKENLKQTEIDAVLKKFDAQSIVVGHTLQSKINRKFNGKVVGIDVKHGKDYHKTLPTGQSEALLIENGIYFRVLASGEKKEI